jgi:hypothetical protein
LSTIRRGYREFEKKAGDFQSSHGAKKQLIIGAIEQFQSEFTLNDLIEACPSVSKDLIRYTLKNLKKTRKVKSLGRGPGALWKKTS